MPAESNIVSIYLHTCFSGVLEIAFGCFYSLSFSSWQSRWCGIHLIIKCNVPKLFWLLLVLFVFVLHSLVTNKSSNCMWHFMQIYSTVLLTSNYTHFFYILSHKIRFSHSSLIVHSLSLAAAGLLHHLIQLITNLTNKTINNNKNC